MSETFVVEMCGCHRDLPGIVTYVTRSRPSTVILIERAGEVPQHLRYKVREFLEGMRDHMAITVGERKCELWHPSAKMPQGQHTVSVRSAEEA